jgi:hypothetical protein
MMFVPYRKHSCGLPRPVTGLALLYLSIIRGNCSSCTGIVCTVDLMIDSFLWNFSLLHATAICWCSVGRYHRYISRIQRRVTASRIASHRGNSLRNAVHLAIGMRRPRKLSQKVIVLHDCLRVRQVAQWRHMRPWDGKSWTGIQRLPLFWITERNF